MLQLTWSILLKVMAVTSSLTFSHWCVGCVCPIGLQGVFVHSAGLQAIHTHGVVSLHARSPFVPELCFSSSASAVSPVRVDGQLAAGVSCETWPRAVRLGWVESWVASS